MNCIICGENLEIKYSLSLNCTCNYKFHYECIFTTLKNDKYNKCPYCAKPFQMLPLINGIKRINPTVHQGPLEYENKMCQSILKSGKNKGNKCDKNCKLGYFTCNRHFKISD